ncbi:MAG: site-specific integrase, partial [Phycisphaeraceae bacterium]
PDDKVIPAVPDYTTIHADLRRAGIPRVDDAGQRVDLHAMRTTLGTMLADGGVPIHHAKRMLRHSSVAITEQHYTRLSVDDTRRAAMGVLDGVGRNWGRIVSVAPSLGMIGDDETPVSEPETCKNKAPEQRWVPLGGGKSCGTGFRPSLRERPHHERWDHPPADAPPHRPERMSGVSGGTRQTGRNVPAQPQLASWKEPGTIGSVWTRSFRRGPWPLARPIRQLRVGGATSDSIHAARLRREFLPAPTRLHTQPDSVPAASGIGAIRMQNNPSDTHATGLVAHALPSCQCLSIATLIAPAHLTQATQSTDIHEQPMLCPQFRHR